ncbi:hypothetical protein [Hansschlegelia beijingensis]|uniref:Uncharacterized protein n=1 Tax=Hansschlegelia beijingensis TaxID=1133344 RepID=A0A7W6D1X4_9HYPH|nr:hypothetical protein [Hansschlegelia beijingensis]MBB3974409.1 hypothetical protein [Hansschlegelia beijingensis]
MPSSEAQPVLRGRTLSAAGGVTAPRKRRREVDHLAGPARFGRAQAGKVPVCGINLGAEPGVARRKIAYLAENVGFCEHLSARADADYLLALAGAPPNGDSVLRPSDAGRRGTAASAGSPRACGRRLQSRRRFCGAPVLLLDKPASSLDPRTTADFNALPSKARDRGAAA